LKGRFENIQHLRGIAALLVVFVHFPTPLAQFCGAIGVDIFFFISGFIIYTSIEKTAYYNKPIDFFKKRLLRILPLYYLVIGSFLLMHFLLDQFRHSLLSPEYTGWDLVRSLLFIPISNQGQYQDPLVFLGWSLNFEMLFYVISVLMMFFFRKNYFWPLFLTLAALSLTGIITMGFSNVYLDFLFSPFLIYFCLGLLLGKYLDKMANFLSRYAELVFLSSVYLLFVVMLGKDYGYEYDGLPREQVLYNQWVYPRVILWGIPALLFFVSYFSLSRKYAITNSFLNELGNRSYSIYLLQVFFIQAYFELAFLTNGFGQVVLSFILMILVVWVSGYSYKYFEKRFHS